MLFLTTQLTSCKVTQNSSELELKAQHSASTPEPGAEDLEIYYNEMANGNLRINVKEIRGQALKGMNCGGRSDATCVFDIGPDGTVTLQDKKYRRWGHDATGEVVNVDGSKAIQTSLGTGKSICGHVLDLSRDTYHDTWWPADQVVQCFILADDSEGGGYFDYAARIKF